MRLMCVKDLENKAAAIRYFFTDVDGTLTDGLVYYGREGEQMKAFSLIDGTGFYLLKQMHIEGGIVTGENSEVVQRRAEKLKLNYCILNSQDKYRDMRRLLESLGSTFDHLAYIGDDLNDLELLRASAISFCPSNAHEIVRKEADVVCKCSGGKGAFREAVEILAGFRHPDIYQLFREDSRK